MRCWVWCLHCERTLEVHLSRDPQVVDEGQESPLDFALEFEMQLGVVQENVVYVICPYESCDGSIFDFRW